MNHTFEWCLDKDRLAIYDKQVFCIDEDGDKYWYLDGQRHRVNGPAIEYARGDKRWWINGVNYSETTYWEEMKK